MKHTVSRRSLLTSAAAVPTAAALAAVPAIAGTRDPILDMIAEADRLYALAAAASARANAAAESVGRDCSGCGLAPLDLSKPELAEMVPWLKRYNVPTWRPERGIRREEIERFNEAAIGPLERIAARVRPHLHKVEEQMLGQYRRANAARLEWWDRRQAEREHNAEVSGFNRLSKEADAICDEWCDANAAVLEAHAVTIEGALAQLAIVANKLKHEIEEDIYNLGTVRAYDALARLLGRSGTA